MKNLSTAMTEIVSGNSTRYYSKYVVAGKEHTEALNNFKYQNIINPNNEITIGNTCASSVTFSVYMPTVSLENKEITVFEGVKVGTEIKYIKLGIFTVTKQTSDGEYTSYEAYDRMYKADMPYFSDMTFPSTDKAILNEICSKLGISLATNIATEHTVSDKPEGYTYREVIGYMAMLQGCNAVINSAGNLEIKWYADSGYVLDGHKYYQQGVTFTTSKNFVIQKLTCNNTKGSSTEQSEITAGDGATGLSFANPFMTQEILNEVYKKIGGFTFRPLTVKFVGDYRLEVGDIITVNKGGVDYKVPIMQITHECDGGLISTVTSIGQSDTENSNIASGPVTKQMQRYYADLIVVNKALINKLDVDTARITYATIKKLEATNATIDNLKANKLDATYADIINANVKNLEVANATITNLKANMLTADIADLNYAKIDFANVTSQVVGTSLIKDGAVTNEKVLNLSANKITAGTLDASRIRVTNLNADNITAGTLNGKRLGNGSIDLDKLAEEVPTKEYLDKVQDELQGQIDGNIETFTKTEIPTLNNEPAVNWTDNFTRKKHIGDICYVVNPASSSDGYSYRFADTGTLEAPNYEWVLIKDSDVTKALQDIININGEITGIKNFNVEVSSWKTDTSEELSSLKKRTTTIETDYSTKQDVTDKINGIQIGGRNILRYSGNFGNIPNSNIAQFWSNNGGGLSINHNIFYLGQPVLQTTIGKGIKGAAYFLDTTKTYTYSAYAFTHEPLNTGTNVAPLAYWCGTSIDKPNNSNIKILNYQQSITNANHWTLLYITFQPLATVFTPFIYRGTGNTLIYIAYLKLEEGTKPTAWSVNPEDVDAAISTKVSTTVFNEVKQTVDENSANITKMTETIKTKADGSTVTTLTNTVNSVKQTANSNSSSISSLTTTVSNVQTTANTAKSTANTAKSTADTANSTANTAKSTADSAKSTATTANNTANTAKSTADSALTKVNTLTTTVTSQGSSITQLQNKITNKVWKTDITESVNNLQIGGVNILPNSIALTDKGWTGTTSTTLNQTDPFGGKKAVLLKGTSTKDSYRIIGNIFKQNGDYTISFWAKADKQFTLFVCEGNNHVFGKAALTTSWGYYTYTYNVTDINSSNRFYFGGNMSWQDISVNVYIAFTKLEKGIKATDWSPAPIDVDSSINAVDNKVTTVSNSYTALNQTVSSLSTEVSQTQQNLTNNYSTTTTMLNKITQDIKDGRSSISLALSGTYAKSSDVSKTYATKTSLDLYIKKDPKTGELKSAIEAIADTINITARGGLNLSGNRFTLSSTNTTITADGTITSNNIIANYGKIAQWNIANNSIQSTTADDKYWVGMTTPAKGTDWVFATLTNEGSSTAEKWKEKWYVRADGLMYSTYGRISGFNFDSNKLSIEDEVYLLPDTNVLHTLQKAIVNNTTSQLSASQYDLNGDGSINSTDLLYAKRYTSGIYTETNFAKWKYAKKSKVQFTINPANVKNAIIIAGTDIWNKKRQTVLGVGTLSSDEISCDNITIKDPVSFDRNISNNITSSTSLEAISNSYTISGNGLLIVNISIWTDTTNDFGTTTAKIYLDGNCVMNNRNRMTNSHPSELAGGATFIWWFADGKTHTLKLEAGSSKDGKKTYTQSMQGLFGLQIS